MSHTKLSAAFLFLLASVAQAADAFEVDLANDLVAWQWHGAGGSTGEFTLRDKAGDEKLKTTGECFELILKDGTVLKSSDFALDGRPKVESLQPEPDSATRAKQLPGKQLLANFSLPDRKLAAQWAVILRDGSRYVRVQLTLRAVGRDVPVKEIVLFNAAVPHAKTMGEVDGSPVVAGNVFLGYEHPMAQNTVDDNQTVRCGCLRNAVLKDGESLTQSCVVGTVPASQLRRGFLDYVERERAHPYRPFLHYNSWYDLRNFDEQQCIDAIHQMCDELVRQRHVQMASFLFDDGWDDTRTLWKFSEKLPNGFEPLQKAADEYDVPLGVWLSPFGGYGTVKQQRLESGRAQGFETNANGFSLAGSKYYQRFQDICLEMVQQYGVNQFKFDGLAAKALSESDNSIRDGDAMLRLIAQLRAVRRDLFINQTTGTWPSPFWLLYVDSTWRGGHDDSYFGKGSLRQQWVTYRDMTTYKNIVKRAPLYPLNSLMLHGIIYAQHAPKLNTADDQEFADEVHDFFGTGTQLQELYLTPKLLNKQNWDDLAEAAKWARANADLLVDSHWIGGDPGKGEVYGWASWSPHKAILVLRNPDDQQASFTVDPQNVFELPPHAAGDFELHSPWVKDRDQPNITVHSGQPNTLRLKPLQVLVLETNALK